MFEIFAVLASINIAILFVIFSFFIYIVVSAWMEDKGKVPPDR